MSPALVCVVVVTVVLAVVLTFVIVCAAAVRKELTSYRERFPPISDAEFMARCRPGTRPEVALKVPRIVAENLGVEYKRVYPSSRFIENLGAD